jgi:hypothetical protein
MRMRGMIIPILCCIFFSVQDFSQAADISIKELKSQNMADVIFVGEIENGDFEKVSSLLQEAKDRELGIFKINLACPGGDVVEAMRIGKLIRGSFMATSSPMNYRGINICFDLPEKDRTSETCNCASACFLVWAAGVWRSGKTLGVHRPYFRKEYFEGLPAPEAQKKYLSMSNEVRAYLKDMDIPTNVTEKMFSASSTEIIYLDEKTIESMRYVPFFDEWLRASCGEHLSHEEIYEMSLLMTTRDYEKKPLSGSEALRLERLSKQDSSYLHCWMNKVYEAQVGKKR